MNLNKFLDVADVSLQTFSTLLITQIVMSSLGPFSTALITDLPYTYERHVSISLLLTFLYTVFNIFLVYAWQVTTVISSTLLLMGLLLNSRNGWLKQASRVEIVSIVIALHMAVRLLIILFVSFYSFIFYV